jgi:hypothetical protein
MSTHEPRAGRGSLSTLHVTETILLAVATNSAKYANTIRYRLPRHSFLVSVTVKSTDPEHFAYSLDAKKIYCQILRFCIEIDST